MPCTSLTPQPSLLTLSKKESEGSARVIVFRLPPTPSLFLGFPPFYGAHTHSNAISSARSGLYSVPLSLPISPYFSSFVAIVRPVRYSKLQRGRRRRRRPNLNGELGIAHRYGLGDSGRSAQIPLSLPMPTHLPLNSHRDWKSYFSSTSTGRRTCTAADRD